MNQKDLIVIGGIGIVSILVDYLSNNASIGKIYDTYPIKPGGRVDKEWAARTIQDRKYIGSSRTNLVKYADPDYTVKYFGLHSVEFGNWMNQEDRLNFLVSAAAGLEDMARVFHARPNQMGLGQTLSVAMGARGFTGAVAHFEPMTNAINQTKMKGYSGSFGHEYGHAIDRHLGRKIKKMFASDGRSTRKELDRKALAMSPDSIQYLMERVFQIFYYDEKGNYTKFAQDLKGLPEYWNRRTEVWARAIERYLMIKMSEKGLVNKFLIKGAPTLNVQGMPPKNLVIKAMPYMRKLIRKVYE